MKKNNENQIISFRKYIFAVSVIFTSLLCFNHIKASTFECEKMESFCIDPNNNCSKRLSVCNKYKQDVLKCEDYVDGYDIREVQYEDTIADWSCGHTWHCTVKKNCGSTHDKNLRRIGEWYGSGCKIGEEKCEVANVCKKVIKTRYDRVNVKVCSRWDINVKFGNAEIDPNLIEY